MLNLSNARLANGAILLAIFEGRRGSFVLAHNEGASTTSRTATRPRRTCFVAPAGASEPWPS
jgi:hypothetical protein